MPRLSELTRKAFFAFILTDEIANFTDLKDEVHKDAHLLVYAAVVYLTLFLYTRQREVHCSFFISS